MLVQWRHHAVQWLASGGYLALLGIGSELRTPHAWRIVTVLTAMVALLAWQVTLRRARAIADTPTSKISSAAQGYVELLGRGKPLAGTTLVAPLRSVPCLWYRYKIEHYSRDKWVTESCGESSEAVAMDDGSGECEVDPEGAEVLAADKETWQCDGRRYTLEVIGPGEDIYVLGAFRTIGGDSLELNLRRDIGERLGEWKKNPEMLRERFDANGDGTVDLQEWETVRAEAQRQVMQEHQEKRAAMPDCHRLGRADDDQPFIISSLPPERLEKRYQFWAVGHAMVFMAALAGLGYFISIA